MTEEDLAAHHSRLESIADRLERLVTDAEEERRALSPDVDPRLEAGMSRLTREVSGAASVARTLATAAPTP